MFEEQTFTKILGIMKTRVTMVDIWYDTEDGAPGRRECWYMMYLPVFMDYLFGPLTYERQM